MMQQQYPSELLEKAVQEFSKLPGIGRKTALRLVLNLLRREEDEVLQFTETIARMRQEVKHCRICHNISDSDVCPICSDPRRDTATICVVENIQDVMAVENTQQFQGLFPTRRSSDLGLVPCAGWRHLANGWHRSWRFGDRLAGGARA